MIYKNCIDACFETVKAAERCAFDCCGKAGGCSSHKKCCIACSEICTVVGRLTARGCCTKDFYQLCIKVCEDCHNHCGKMDHELTCACAAAAKKCAECCHQCLEDCR